MDTYTYFFSALVGGVGGYTLCMLVHQQRVTRGAHVWQCPDCGTIIAAATQQIVEVGKAMHLNEDPDNGHVEVRRDNADK